MLLFTWIITFLGKPEVRWTEILWSKFGGVYGTSDELFSPLLSHSLSVFAVTFLLGCKIHEMLFTFAIPVSQKRSWKCADQSNKGLVKVLMIELRMFFLSFMMGNPLLMPPSAVCLWCFISLLKQLQRDWFLLNFLKEIWNNFVLGFCGVGTESF